MWRGGIVPHLPNVVGSIGGALIYQGGKNSRNVFQSLSGPGAEEKTLCLESNICRRSQSVYSPNKAGPILQETDHYHLYNSYFSENDFK
jgi:hypothetical protein